MRDSFPDDHAIEALRGMRRLRSRDVKRTLVSRCGWLQDKIAQWVVDGKPPSLLLRELAATAQAAEAFEEIEAQAVPEVIYLRAPVSDDGEAAQ